MLFITYRRLYLLDNKQPYYYSNFFGYSYLKKVNQRLNLNSNHSIKKAFLNELINPEINYFWTNAPSKIRSALLFSYNYSKNKHSETLNVQIDPWTSVPFFRNTIKNLNSHPSYTSFVRLNGTHNLNLRFANVHLCIDSLSGKDVYQIHWDANYPLNFKDFILHHFNLKNNIFR